MSPVKETSNQIDLDEHHERLDENYHLNSLLESEKDNVPFKSDHESVWSNQDVAGQVKVHEP